MKIRYPFFLYKSGGPKIITYGYLIFWFFVAAFYRQCLVVAAWTKPSPWSIRLKNGMEKVLTNLVAVEAKGMFSWSLNEVWQPHPHWCKGNDWLDYTKHWGRSSLATCWTYLRSSAETRDPWLWLELKLNVYWF